MTALLGILLVAWLFEKLRQVMPERGAGYCKPGPDSDVHAYFHRMGHHVCATCRWWCRSKGGLLDHLEEHRRRGDRVPDAAFERLRREQAESWS